MTSDIRLAYEAAGAGWGGGPSRIYGALAQPLLDAVGVVEGRRVLDVGTGAGVVARALVVKGASVVASDLAIAMLRSRAAFRPSAVVADVLALPFRAKVFDLAVAAFVLNHLADPSRGLRQMRDVTRRGGTMVATGFEGQPSHPVKTVVDRVAHGYGFQPPQWYVAMQAVASTLGTAERFADVARDADLDKIEVWRELVRPEGLTAADLVDWRLGMAHLAGFVATLTASDREDLRAQAISSLSAEVPPLELPVLVLRAQC